MGDKRTGTQGTVLCLDKIFTFDGNTGDGSLCCGERGKSVVYGFNVYESIDYLYVKIMEW